MTAKTVPVENSGAPSLKAIQAADQTKYEFLESTNGALHVVDQAVHPGESSTFDRTWGGAAATEKLSRTTTGAVGAAGARMYYGYIVTTAIATSPVTIYDNTSAAGTVIDVIPTGTTAGTRGLLPVAIPCTLGIYASFGGTGTVLFLYC